MSTQDATGYEDEDSAPCQTCGGDGVEECEEWLFQEDTDASEECWEQDCNGRVHTCPNCRGSGNAKDQWYR